MIHGVSAWIRPLALGPNLVLQEGEGRDWHSWSPRCSACWETSRRISYWVHENGVCCNRCGPEVIGDRFDDARQYFLDLDSEYMKGFRSPKEFVKPETVERAINLLNKSGFSLTPREHDLSVLLNLPGVPPSRIYLLEGADEYLRIETVPLTGEYEGGPGERIEREITCLNVIHLGTGERGERYLAILRTVSGNDLLWYTGENCSLQPGSYYIVKATVHKDRPHSDYRGRRQTSVQRVKVVTDLGPNPSNTGQSGTRGDAEDGGSDSESSVE